MGCKLEFLQIIQLFRPRPLSWVIFVATPRVQAVKYALLTNHTVDRPVEGSGCGVGEGWERAQHNNSAQKRGDLLLRKSAC